jgi:uncharacterized protein
MAKTRVLFVSDTHGSDKLYLKLMNAAPLYEAKVVVIGGDIAGKEVIPIFDRGGVYATTFLGTPRTAKTQEELEALKKEIRFLGIYPHVTTEEEWGQETKDEKRMNGLFDVLISESLSRWCGLAEERLKPKGIRMIVNNGNDDPDVVAQTIQKSDFVEWPNERVLDLDGQHEMLNLGYSCPTPWKLPGDIPEEDLAGKIEALVSSVKNMKYCSFNIHVPPIDTHLDIAPLLNPDLTPKFTPGGEPEMGHVGSTAVRKEIERLQPLLGLHGHVHESRGYSKIGRTHCFNPGSEISTGILHGALLDLSDDKLANYAFTSG